MEKILFAFFLVIGSVHYSSASDRNLCEIEALTFEQEAKFEDVIKFISEQNIKVDQIAFPDMYVYAYDWLNTPYRYGGNSKNGIDCSRFVMRVYNEALGIEANGTSRQLFQQGRKIDKSDLREGDLVFFKTRGNSISHVGIYLHKGKFVHASSSQGVMVSSLNNPYWSRTYYSSARFFETHPF